jgi:hypothetical protein
MRKVVVYGSSVLALAAFISGVVAFLNGSALLITCAALCTAFIGIAIFAHNLTIGP